ncbi:hypothetical protein BD779DRAFT_1510964 [Infundibulicybe gibba]|nr:hypothetical protein BD779DRAFT_1510964 [Infundibulicybe gibba]
MTAFYSYSPKTTSISFPWPAGITGLERIALSAQGDLQRVLSAFFARPISIALVYSHSFTGVPDNMTTPLTLPNPSALAAASPETPILQTRQVHLQCGGKIVCTATSTVRMTSPYSAHLFLEEKYGIGQMFSQLAKVPYFELLNVGIDRVDDLVGGKWSTSGITSRVPGQEQLWRKYKLVVPEFECEILEVFPSREMFLHGDKWLSGTYQGLQVRDRTFSAVTVFLELLLCILVGGLLLCWAISNANVIYSA